MFAMNVIVRIPLNICNVRKAIRPPASSHPDRYWEQIIRKYPKKLTAIVPRMTGFLPTLELIWLITLHATIAIGHQVRHRNQYRPHLQAHRQLEWLK
jgi:hypothetical protein